MLIYLNGTSSSGKSSIAVEIQKQLEEPCFYFSIDTLLYSLAKEELEAIIGKQPYRAHLDWLAIFSGYFGCVSALIKAGNNVIADCPIYNSKLAEIFNEHLHSVSEKKVVKVLCSLEEIEKREKQRGDRVLGIARKQFDEIHSHLSVEP